VRLGRVYPSIIAIIKGILSGQQCLISKILGLQMGDKQQEQASEIDARRQERRPPKLRINPGR
jgi:hypothetical protein